MLEETDGIATPVQGPAIFIGTYENASRYLGADAHRSECLSSGISTDYSVYAEMTISEVMWNSFRNKLLAAWYQKQGVIVIPNVSWSRPWSYGFCFDGFPKNSIIAINSTGIGNDSFSIKLWIEGYQRALEVLEPVKIIRYGAKIDGENEAISIYFPNDNYKSASYGR